MKNICVFCGSSPGNSSTYFDAAHQFGALLAQKGHALVYGGGSTGLMGALADGALEHGGEVTGVIPNFLVEREREHRGITRLVEVNSMHQRKQKMTDLSDAFVVLPGGMGTMDEFCEILTWAQLGLHKKPIGILNVRGYFDLFIGFIDNMVNSGFFSKENKRLILADDDPLGLLQQMSDYRAPDIEAWLNRYRN